MSSFHSLHPAVQHHVVNSLGWKDLRPFQEDAIPHILEGKHAIILAPTAGGKTEAVILPILSRMLSESWTGVSVLYLCPIKALINDLGIRLDRYLTLVGRRSEVWHGDVDQSRRKRMLAEPPDLLLTTPESLEVMLTSSVVDGRTFLKSVKAVIVDEIHSFAGDDRGWHLLCLLSRLSRICDDEFQRVGLSATVGNPEYLADWLAGACQREKIVLLPPDTPRAECDVQLDFVGSLENAAHVISRLYRSQKRLVFVDSRAQAERLGSELRKTGVRAYVTHSSLSRAQRTEAEEAFRSIDDCVIVATSVLELGVDVGDLDRVIQVDAPPSVSAFLQRMGRTGRREGNLRNCLFLATREESLLRAAGLIELFESGYVEPVKPPRRPFHILAQQIMALALQERGIGRHTWFEWLEGVQAFEEMDRPTIEYLVTWMLDNDVLSEDQGLLWIGRKGEEAFGRKHFLELLSVFVSPPFLTVLHGRDEIGYIDERALLGEARGARSLLLGGRVWSVQHVEWRRRQAYVEPAAVDEGQTWWPGGGTGSSFEICQAVKRILATTEVRSGWSSRATSRIEAARQELSWIETGNKTFLVQGKGGQTWWTFAGARANGVFSSVLSEALSLNVKADDFTIRFSGDISVTAVAKAIETLSSSGILEYACPLDERAIEGLKFAEALPMELALQSLRERMNDPDAISSLLSASLQLVLP